MTHTFDTGDVFVQGNDRWEIIDKFTNQVDNLCYSISLINGNQELTIREKRLAREYTPIHSDVLNSEEMRDQFNIYDVIVQNALEWVIIGIEYNSKSPNIYRLQGTDHKGYNLRTEQWRLPVFFKHTERKCEIYDEICSI